MKHAAEPEVTVPFKCDPSITKVWYEDDYSSILCNIVDSKMESGCSFEEALSEYVIEYPEMTFERAKSLYEKWHK